MTGRKEYPPRYLGPTAEDIVEYCQLQTPRELLLAILDHTEVRVEMGKRGPSFHWHDLKLDREMVMARVWVQLRGLYLFRQRTGAEGTTPGLQEMGETLDLLTLQAKQTGEWPGKE